MSVTLHYTENRRSLVQLNQCATEWRSCPLTLSTIDKNAMRCYDYIVDAFRTNNINELTPSYIAYRNNTPQNLYPLLRQFDTDCISYYNGYSARMINATLKDHRDFTSSKAKLIERTNDKARKIGIVAGATTGGVVLGGTVIGGVCLVTGPVGWVVGGFIFIGGTIGLGAGAAVGGITHLTSQKILESDVPDDLRSINTGSAWRTSEMTRIASEEFHRIEDLFNQLYQRRQKLRADLQTNLLSLKAIADANAELSQINRYVNIVKPYYLIQLPGCRI